MDQPLRLGVVWCLYPDESHNADGKHTGYLTGSSATGNALRACDPELWEQLRRLVVGNSRHVVEIRKSGLLPDTTVYFERSLTYPRSASRSLRQAIRNSWTKCALGATLGTELIFVDPDNGISNTIDPLGKKGPKYVTVDELRRYTDRGQSLVIYHHLGRRAKAVRQIMDIAKGLQVSMKSHRLPWALWYHRGTARAYFILAQEHHRHMLENRLVSFLAGSWGTHFDLIE